jgi:hypothetical protein
MNVVLSAAEASRVQQQINRLDLVEAREMLRLRSA